MAMPHGRTHFLAVSPFTIHTKLTPTAVRATDKACWMVSRVSSKVLLLKSMRDGFPPGFCSSSLGS